MNEEEKKRVEEEEQSIHREDGESNVESTDDQAQSEDVSVTDEEPIAETETEETDIQTEPVPEAEQQPNQPPIPHEVGELNVDSNIAPNEPEPVPEKMLTQSQVNELVGRARQEGRESAMRELYGRYGVSNDEEMNDVFGRGQTYAALDDEYNKQKESMVQLMTENALLKSNIDAARWDDVKYILKGKGYEVTPENIEAEIASHPEWRTVTPPTAVAPVAADQNQPQPQAQQAQQQPPTVLRRLGSEATVKDDGSTDTEEDRVRNLFGM